MSSLRYTLLAEGSSDRALLPILNWLFRQHLPNYEVDAEWADLAKLQNPPKGLANRIQKALELFPCQLLFIHRDADNQGIEHRVDEIKQALTKLDHFQTPVIKVIPVRMTEAWLLFNENAIRMAASNPRGKTPLGLPNIKGIENIEDPKTLLHSALRQASNLSGRRLKRFRPREQVHRVSELIDDFSPLRVLPAFQATEAKFKNFIYQCLDASES